MKLSEDHLGRRVAPILPARTPLAANDGEKEMALRAMIVAGADGLKRKGV